MSKIIGITVGSPLPKPDLRQTDPTKGDYVKGKDIIPTKVSQLENDAEYATEQQLGELSADKLDKTELTTAINTALTQAKNSGEFKGDPGTPGSNGKDGTSVTVSNVSESTADGGTNVVTFSDGKKLNVKNGSKGSDGKTPIKGTDYFTEADKEEIARQAAGMVEVPSGSWNDLKDKPSSFPPASHEQAASTITEGTFAGQVVANASGQAAGSYVLRNSKLSSAEESPSVNGQICWKYE